MLQAGGFMAVSYFASMGVEDYSGVQDINMVMTKYQKIPA